MILYDNDKRTKVDYSKTLYELSKAELIQIILDFLDQGDFNSWRINN